MLAGLQAVRLAIYSLLMAYLPDIAIVCPWLTNRPTVRSDATPQLFMSRLQQEVHALDAEQGAELLFLGDSITELWRGTDMGWTSSRTKGAPLVFHRYFGSKYRTLVMGVGGDQVGHLHWRVLNGNLPAHHEPAVTVLLVGINDLLVGETCWPENVEAIEAIGNTTALGILDLTQTLLDRLPHTRLVLMTILPAGDWRSNATRYDWPNSLSPGILSANRWLLEASLSEEKIVLLDCSHLFLPHGKIEPKYQMDGVHPSHEGLEVLAKCMHPTIDQLMLNRQHEHRHTHAHVDASLGTTDSSTGDG